MKARISLQEATFGADELKSWCERYYTDIHPYHDEHRQPVCLCLKISDKEYQSRLGNFKYSN